MATKRTTRRSRRPREESLQLRDLFAGFALAGICARSDAPDNENEVAEAAYDLADAMLEVRDDEEDDEG